MNLNVNIFDFNDKWSTSTWIRFCFLDSWAGLVERNLLDHDQICLFSFHKNIFLARLSFLVLHQKKNFQINSSDKWYERVAPSSSSSLASEHVFSWFDEMSSFFIARHYFKCNLFKDGERQRYGDKFTHLDEMSFDGFSCLKYFFSGNTSSDIERSYRMLSTERHQKESHARKTRILLLFVTLNRIKSHGGAEHISPRLSVPLFTRTNIIKCLLTSHFTLWSIGRRKFRKSRAKCIFMF